MSNEKYLDERVTTLGKTIYHYSSFGTLDGILKTKTLWLCSTANMNDTKEQRYFIEDLHRSVKSEIPTKFHSKCDAFFERLFATLDIEYPYAMCFSLLKDNAAQWERYANNGSGICIGFNTRNIAALFCNPHVNLRKINYGFDSKKHDHFEVVVKYITEDTYTKRFTNERQIRENILACATAFKHESFKTEDECRLTSFWAYPCMRESSYEFVTINGVVKKVLKVDLDALCANENIDFEDLFDKIIIGPRSHQRVFELKQYIQSIGYEKISERISKSDCPLR